MSSDGCSDLPDEPQHAAHGESSPPHSGPQPGSPGDVKLVEAIRLLRLGTLPINSVEFAETTSILAHPQPLTPFTGNANCHHVAEGTAPHHSTEAG